MNKIVKKVLTKKSARNKAALAAFVAVVGSSVMIPWGT